MDKKVYYGEYTLKYWIEMLLKKDIILPPYQRGFVWSPEQVKGFINGLNNDGFVPPVTIGVCNIDGVNHNIILDGQQRLSSLLLAYFRVYPKKDAFPRQSGVLGFADGTAEEDTNESDIEYINWSLRNFADKGPVEDVVRNSLSDAQYINESYGVSADFFESKYIPFSFIIPNAASETEQQEFYSTVFRTINILGSPLTPMESRKSLYFLKSELKSFFEPECCRNFKIELIGKQQSYDFVRSMALLSQYEKEGRFNRLAQSYKNRMEKYYEEYIYSVVNDREDGMFAGFSTVFPSGNYELKINKLQSALHELGYAHLRFTSIIDADIYMFGLIYYTVIKGYDLDFSRKEELLQTLPRKVNSLKHDDGHKNAPSLLKYLRSRIEQSITIFKKYVIRPTS